MKVFVKKTLKGLVPCDITEFDKLQSAKLKLNEVYEITIIKKRNTKFHRKFFALLKLFFDNQDVCDNIDDLRAYLTMKAGYIRRIETDKGVMLLPKSISFSNMDNIEFSEFYSKCLDVIASKLNIDQSEIIEEFE